LKASASRKRGRISGAVGWARYRAAARLPFPGLSPGEQRAGSVSGILRITGKGRGGRAPPAKWRTAMNTRNAQINALSDKELDIVSAGQKPRVQVTKEQYEQILEVKMMFASLKK
jgi:hypothetical protein